MSWEIQLFDFTVYIVKFGIAAVIAYAVLKEAIIAALKESRLNNESDHSEL